MKKVINILLGLSIIFGYSSDIFAISYDMAFWCTTATTSIATLSSIAATKMNDFELIPSILFSSGVSLFSGLFFYFIFFNMTPDARVKRAMNILKKISEEPLIDIAAHYYDDPQVLVHCVYSEYFNSTLPLIDAFNRFIRLRLMLNSAKELLESAINDGIEFRVIDSYSKYCEVIEQYHRWIDNALAIIKQDSHWIESLHASMIQNMQI